jgi:mRNA interferase YafQ
LKLCRRRGLDIDRLSLVIAAIQADGAPPVMTRPHALRGAWIGFSECHIAPDWLLIYQVDEEEVRLYRTGTHSDLF